MQAHSNHSYSHSLRMPDPMRMPDTARHAQNNLQEFQKLKRTARLASSRQGFARRHCESGEFTPCIRRVHGIPVPRRSARRVISTIGSVTSSHGGVASPRESATRPTLLLHLRFSHFGSTVSPCPDVFSADGAEVERGARSRTWSIDRTLWHASASSR